MLGRKANIWIRGLLAAVIQGAAGGVTTGFAAMGIAPESFNLGAGFTDTLKIAAVSAGLSAIMGVAAYLKQSPLPPEDTNSQDLPKAAPLPKAE